MKNRAKASPSPLTILPPLCSDSVTLITVVVSLAFVLVIALAVASSPAEFWLYLGLLSLYLLWITLLLLLLLCLLQRYLEQLPFHWALSLTLLLLLLDISLVNETVLYLIEHLQLQAQIPFPAYLRWHSLAIGAIIGTLVLRYTYMQHQWQLKRSAATLAQLEALQARIRPHFLFNALNTIVALIHTRPDVAEETLLNLADLLRAALNAGSAPVPLAQEIALTQHYLALEQLRLGERLRLQWQLPDPLPQVLLPPLTLQPLAENAIYHGIEPCRQGGQLTIRITVKEDKLHICLINPLPPEKSRRQGKQGQQLALDNIRQRLALLEPAAGALQTTSDSQFFSACVMLQIAEAAVVSCPSR
ncbi:MAG: histidine kinase [Gammaproteobacteria bacterium]|nr:histidine kinase [Gammaproteobacteria bacterium]